MKKMIVVVAGLLLVLPAIASAVGLQGACVDCHTMHNSEQGSPVAVMGLNDTLTVTPIPNLLRMDCIACHVIDQNGGDRVVDMGNGSAIPQVWHEDTAGDLAGGNWEYVDQGTSRNGHNVADLFAGGDDNGGTYGAPPGKFRDSTHGPSFGGSATPFADFTCAGSGGCHGTRSQMLTGFTDANVVGTVDGPDFWTYTERTGIAAVSGAHHANFDGVKNADENYQDVPGVHDGNKVADGYRFIPGLQGYGNQVNRWENNDADHNEYYGNSAGLDKQLGETSSCQVCHVQGIIAGGSPRMNADSTIRVPNQSMSGFCATCHGVFHSVGAADPNGLSASVGMGSNGVSGAFQRHPSDYVIPTTGEYAGYTVYTNTAPVARDDITGFTGGGSTVVTPGSDMVMCLSCHKAHASEYDYMLRFDYALQSAGNAAAADLGTGCLACHTTKGLPKSD